MKKVTLLLTLLLFSSFGLSAQMKYRKGKQEKIKAAKVAFITDKLDLTEKEAQQFWPLYNSFQKKINSLRFEERQKIKKQIGGLENLDALSESEAKQIVKRIGDIKSDVYKTEKEFQQKLKGILSYKKVLKLEIAEREFHRTLIRKLKHRRIKK